MASSTFNTIVIWGEPNQKEATAGGTVTPGDLLQWSAGRLIRHATAGGNASPSFAVENDAVASGISDDYASGVRAKYVVANKGEEIYGLLASGQNVNKGDFLESAGNGALRAYSNQSGQNVYVKSIVAVAFEAKDNSSGDASGPHNNATRIRLEVV